MSLQTRLTALATAVGTDIKDIKSKQGTLILDPWHTVGAAGEPAFLNGWVNYGSGYSTLQFRKDPFGKVQLRGAIKGGTVGQAVFALPVGYRPAATDLYTSWASGNTVPVTVQVNASDGLVYIQAPAAANTSCDLTTIEFDTDTVTQVLAGPKGDKGDPGAVGGNATIPMDTWHVVGTTGEPAFQNSWVNFGGTNATLAFRKDPLGKVNLRGTIKGGANGTVVVTLPVGYRPPADITIPVETMSGTNTAYCSVSAANGQVAIGGQPGITVTTATWVDAVEFDTESVTQMPTGPQGPQGIPGVPGSSVQVPLDTWHKVGTAGEPAFVNNWTNFTVGTQVAQFRKYPDGKVKLSGYIKGGATGVTVFTLPVGYRPIDQVGVIAFKSTGSVLLTVDPNGPVTISQLTGTLLTTDLVSLDSMEFDTESVTQFAVGPQGPQGPQGVPGNSITVPMDTWHTVGGSSQPAFGTGWGALAGTTVQFRKDPLGKVMIRGQLRNSIAFTFPTTLFTLPSGYWPVADWQFNLSVIEPSGANSSITQVVGRVSSSDGTVKLVGGMGATNPTGAVNSYVLIDEIDFDTGTVTQMPTGPAGPQGPPGGLAGVLRDQDELNSELMTFRSRLRFPSPNFHITDGGPADPFGGGDYTKIDYGPGQISTAPPGVSIQEGTEYDVSVAPGVTWRMRYSSTYGWVMVGGAPLLYTQVGENNAYAGFASGQSFCVNAASKLLRWQITPLVNVWAEVEFFIGLFQKNDAAYHYIQISPTISPAPPVTAFTQTATRTQHSTVQQFEPYFVKTLVGLSAGVAYSIGLTAGTSGGSWQYYQGANTINMSGKAWPR